MQRALGIDTGGTYANAVLMNHETGALLAGAMSLQSAMVKISIGRAGADHFHL